MKAQRIIRATIARRLGASLLFLLAASVPASTVFAGHTTDGVVSPGEWTTPTTSSLSFPFDSSTGAGGATLYVDQGSATGGPPGGQGFGVNLYLLYDYGHNTSPPTSSTFFDVFFQVTPTNTDYLVRIMGNTFSAYEKPDGIPAPTPGGGFDPTQSPWTPLTSSDLALAGFQGAIGFGQGVTAGPDHQLAEFQLTINSSNSGNPNGIYDPSPAFWSASTGGITPASDPPISSAIFQLNPDGSTIVTPVLAPNGDPILQPLGSVPEPSSIILAGAGILGLLGYRLATSRLGSGKRSLARHSQ